MESCSHALRQVLGACACWQPHQSTPSALMRPHSWGKTQLFRLPSTPAGLLELWSSLSPAVGSFFCICGQTLQVPPPLRTINPQGIGVCPSF